MNDTADQNETPTFRDLGLSDEVLRAIDSMGFVEPTPVQMATFRPAIEGRDLVVQARTGTGKTAAFGLPLVDKLVKQDGGPQALILAPTRELALQSSKEIARLGANRGIRTAAIYGGAPMDRQVRELAEGAQIVSGTPGRVLDHLKRGTLDGSRLRVLVLDEADEMLSMGFAKELHSIIALLPTKRQTMLFSATIEGAVDRMAARILVDPERISLSSDAVGAQGVTHYYYLITTGKTRDLVRILENEDPESAVIFCNTKMMTERVAAELQAAGFNADWLNGDLPQNEREKVLAATRSGQLRFLVATDVAARGIDISHLTHVINHDFPENIESYIHRTGRTGRAGRTGTAISLVAPAELGSLYYLRLQYKIFPIERSLPSAGEMQTRKETDQIGLLGDAFPKEPSEIDRAVARRLLTHPHAERLLGGLLHAFFGGTEDVEEEAAAARRDRPARPAPEPPRERSKPEPRRPRPEPRAEQPRAEQPRAEQPRAEPASPARVEAAPSQPEAAVEAEPARDTLVGGRARDDVPRADVPRTDDRASDDEGDEEHEGEDDVFLYVNVGRRDGVRPGEIIRLLAEECALEKGEVGRIRIRDRHTFVGVPREKADSIVDQLTGVESHEKALVVELARAER